MASTFRKINDVVGTEAHLDAGRQALYGDDGRGAHQPRSDRGTEADGTLGEDCDNVADADGAALSAGEPGGHDVGAHQTPARQQARQGWGQGSPWRPARARILAAIDEGCRACQEGSATKFGAD
jgi:hypothetical protein